MTSEQISMLKRLKGKIDEYMGKKQLKDEVFLEDGHCGFISRIKSKKDGGYIYVTWEDGKESCDKPKFSEDFFRIPPAITPDGKRCLIDMVHRFDVMYKFNDSKWHLETDFHKAGTGVEADDPYTAILKALCEQFEV